MFQITDFFNKYETKITGLNPFIQVYVSNKPKNFVNFQVFSLRLNPFIQVYVSNLFALSGNSIGSKTVLIPLFRSMFQIEYDDIKHLLKNTSCLNPFIQVYVSNVKTNKGG